MYWFRAAAFILFSCSCFGANTSSWQEAVQDRLPLYGHRNWIVIADAAYPEQSAPGIETVYAPADAPQVLQYVLHAIDNARHVTPVVLMDKELTFIPEADAPGITSYRESLRLALGERTVNTLPHEKIIARLADVSRSFNVLIIKTKALLPYTSVFLQLECAYWPPDAEARLRATMAANR